MLRRLKAPAVRLILSCRLAGCIFPYHRGYCGGDGGGYGGGGGGFHGPVGGPGPGGPGPGGGGYYQH
jgi:hypothetical protein